MKFHTRATDKKKVYKKWADTRYFLRVEAVSHAAKQAVITVKLVIV